MPKGLKVGDWLVTEGMGAYTICAASTFNGIRRSEIRYTLGAGEDAEAVRSLCCNELRMNFRYFRSFFFFL